MTNPTAKESYEEMTEQEILKITCHLNISNNEYESKVKDFCFAMGQEYSVLIPQINNFVRDFGYFPSSVEELRMKPIIEISHTTNYVKFEDRK